MKVSDLKLGQRLLARNYVTSYFTGSSEKIDLDLVVSRIGLGDEWTIIQSLKHGPDGPTTWLLNNDQDTDTFGFELIETPTIPTERFDPSKPKMVEYSESLKQQKAALAKVQGLEDLLKSIENNLKDIKKLADLDRAWGCNDHAQHALDRIDSYFNKRV